MSVGKGCQPCRRWVWLAVLVQSASGRSDHGVVFRPVGNETGPVIVEAAAYWDAKPGNPVLRRFLALIRAGQLSDRATAGSAEVRKRANDGVVVQTGFSDGEQPMPPAQSMN